MIRIRSPGRICLFGEHQDYLGYPIISLAISKYIFLEAQKVNKPVFSIHFPDISTEVDIKLENKELTYKSNRDYIKSGYNLFVREGIKFTRGYDIKIWGNLPINAGVASSSALVIAWLYFLSIISNREINSYNLALQGYYAEVNEFNEAGGMMDHFSSVFGKLIFLQEQVQKPSLNFYNFSLNGFILGNSMEHKSTVDDLRKVKKNSLDSFRILKEIYPDFNKYTTSLAQITPYLDSIEKKFRKKLIGNLSNRDITNNARYLIDNYYKIRNIATESQKLQFYSELGVLLNQHHQNLRDYIGVSTPTIDEMIKKSIQNGALGCKINGSGFGGTMFALAPGNEQTIVEMLTSLGFEAHVLNTSDGVETY